MWTIKVSYFHQDFLSLSNTSPYRVCEIRAICNPGVLVGLSLLVMRVLSDLK